MIHQLKLGSLLILLSSNITAKENRTLELLLKICVMPSPNRLIKKYLNQYIFIINLSITLLEIHLLADLFNFHPTL